MSSIDWMVELTSDVEARQIAALQHLGTDLDPTQPGALLDAIRDLTSASSPALRYHARLALDEIGQRAGRRPQSLPTDPVEIQRLLTHEAPEVRLKGVLASYYVQGDSLFAELTSLVRTEKHPWVKASLVKALAQYRRNRSIPLLVGYLNDADGRVRANTVEALGVFDNPLVLARVAEMVDDPEHRVQSAVLTLLGRDAAGNIRPRIESMLGSGLVWLQASAVHVIQETSPPWALEVLDWILSRGIEDRRIRGRVNNLMTVLRRRSDASLPVSSA